MGYYLMHGLFDNARTQWATSARRQPGFQRHVYVHPNPFQYPFPLALYVIVSALPFRSAVAVALTVWKRKK